MIHILQLALLALPLPADRLYFVSLSELLDRPFVELIEESQQRVYSETELEAMRSALEQERDGKIAKSKRQEELWKDELSAARRELKEINERSSVDSDSAGARRTQLHEIISNLEPRIPQETRNRKETIPAYYEVRLAKLWLIERWPRRLEKVVDRIEEGEARDRRHGDVQDIGYRRIVKQDLDKDFEAGEQALRQMTASGVLSREVQDQEVQGYVRGVASKLAANSDLKVPLRVMVLDEVVPRAIGLPNGSLYITSGVLTAARSESELAGVLSLEIARIAARHATRGSKRSFISRMVVPAAQLAAGFFTAGVHPGAHYGIGFGLQGLDGVANRTLNSSDAQHQKEADQLAVQYAWKAGFDPKGLVAFMDSLVEEGRGALIGNEPPLPERLLNLYAEIAYLPQPQRPIVDSPEFIEAKRNSGRSSN